VEHSGGLGLVEAIGVAIVAAAALAVVFHRLKQPALLAFIVAGLLLGRFGDTFAGSAVEMREVSHLGLVFLLFLIGMEMDLRGILTLGPRAAAAILLQAPLSIGVVLAIQALAQRAGAHIPGLAGDSDATIYFAVAASLGSTAVVVKLLGDKFDLGSRAGRVTVLTLVAQDVWAVVALSWVLARGSGEVSTLLSGAALLALACFTIGALLLPRVLERASATPDLVAVIALGWCFVWAEAFRRVGLSAELGALAAGLAIGRLPQRIEILARVSSLRDFFLALFFVALGMSLPTPTTAVLGQASALVLLVVVSRFVLFSPSLLAAGLGPIVSLAAPINLAQLSEFSLLLVSVGMAKGALAPSDASVISYALMLSVILSTYAIPANYRIAAALARVAGRVETAPEPVAAGRASDAPIVFLGYYVNAEAIARTLARDAPELLPHILVIDFNLRNHPRIRAHGMRVAYGDVSNPDSLRRNGVAGARVVVSTISDAFLRGISNAALLDQVRAINREALFVATAPTEDEARRLVSRGAFACVSPPIEAAAVYVRAIRDAIEAPAGIR
jgi:Kef-type K+ transport system membrane component KefB